MFLLAGCASEKSKPVLQRGWIGGDYVLAKRESAWGRLGFCAERISGSEVAARIFWAVVITERGSPA